MEVALKEIQVPPSLLWYPDLKIQVEKDGASLTDVTEMVEFAIDLGAEACFSEVTCRQPRVR